MDTNESDEAKLQMQKPHLDVYHGDRCVVCLERESTNCMVEAATFVWMSGGDCIHTAEWQLLALNIVILLHYLFFISLILLSIFYFHHKNIHDI